MTAWTDSMGFFQHPEQSEHHRVHRGYDANSAVPDQNLIISVLQRLNPQRVELPAFSAYEKKFDGMLNDLAKWHHPSPHHRPKGTLAQVWGRCNSIRMKREYEDQNRMKFDMVVVTRYDIAYGQAINLATLPQGVVITDGMFGSSVISDAWCCGPSDLINKWGQQMTDIPHLVQAGTMSLGPHEWLAAHFAVNDIPWAAHGVGISIQR